MNRNTGRQCITHKENKLRIEDYSLCTLDLTNLYKAEVFVRVL